MSNVNGTYDVIVIGAGVAGAAAAHGVAQKGYKVTVLEARNRLGGRTWTDSKTGAELGGAWIEGDEGNPLIELANRMGIETRKIPGNSVIDGGLENCCLIDLDNGAQRLPLTANFKAGELYNKLQEDVEAMSLDEKLPKETTVAYAIKTLENKYKLNDLDQKLLDWMKELAFQLDWGVDPEFLSLRHFDEDKKDFHEYGEGCRIIPGGMIQFVQKLLENIEVRLNSPVVSIDRISPKSVLVTTSDEKRFIASHVIVTVPLGVLKAHKIRFSPPLPAPKLDAIQRIGFGAFEKLLLVFDKAFWDVSWYNYAFLTNDNQQWRVAFNVVWEKPIPKPALLLLKGGKEGEFNELLSDQELIYSAMRLLRTVFEKEGNVVPQPVHYMRTNWKRDPYSLGAYSSIPVGASPQLFQVLAQPVHDALFFAGEATSHDQWQSIHGAYLSGLRTVEEIENVRKGSSKAKL